MKKLASTYSRLAVTSHRIASHPTPSHPIPSHPITSHPIHHSTSHHITSRHITLTHAKHRPAKHSPPLARLIHRVAKPKPTAVLRVSPAVTWVVLVLLVPTAVAARGGGLAGIRVSFCVQVFVVNVIDVLRHRKIWGGFVGWSGERLASPEEVCVVDVLRCLGIGG